MHNSNHILGKSFLRHTDTGKAVHSKGRLTLKVVRDKMDNRKEHYREIIAMQTNLNVQFHCYSEKLQLHISNYAS